MHVQCSISRRELSSADWSILSQLYADPSDVDLFAAGVAERNYAGGVLGRTFGCIVGRQFRVSFKPVNHGAFAYLLTFECYFAVCRYYILFTYGLSKFSLPLQRSTNDLTAASKPLFSNDFLYRSGESFVFMH